MYQNSNQLKFNSQITPLNSTNLIYIYTETGYCLNEFNSLTLLNTGEFVTDTEAQNSHII